MKDAVAIIPARGGSKRIKNKNIREFAGVPIIAHSIRAARESGEFARVIVSTDDDKIASVALEYGAEVPFRRPPALSDDHTATAPVLCHALDFLSREGSSFPYFACIYATSPFIRADDLKYGLDMLRRGICRSAFSVTTFAFPIFRGLRLTEEGQVSFVWPEHAVTRSQDLPETYHDAGMFYLFQSSAFLELAKKDPPDQMPIIMPGAMPVILPRTRVQDIDTPEDWEFAENLFQVLSLRGEM